MYFNMNTYLTWQFYIIAYSTPISHVGFHLPALFRVNVALYFSYPRLRMSSVFHTTTTRLRHYLKSHRPE